MTSSISKRSLVFLALFAILGVTGGGFVNAQITPPSEAFDTCTVRSTVTADEVQRLTGQPGGPYGGGNVSSLSLEGNSAGNNGLICTYSLIKWATNLLFLVVLTVAILLLLWAAFLWVTAGARGESDQSNKAKQVLLYAIVGLIVAGIAFVLPNIIIGIIGLT
ncbi:MAG: hypothetical protein WD850_01130 [Candidatus Spechtbacterales bacterium]